MKDLRRIIEYYTALVLVATNDELNANIHLMNDEEKHHLLACQLALFMTFTDEEKWKIMNEYSSCIMCALVKGAWEGDGGSMFNAILNSMSWDTDELTHVYEQILASQERPDDEVLH